MSDPPAAWTVLHPARQRSVAPMPPSHIFATVSSTDHDKRRCPALPAVTAKALLPESPCRCVGDEERISQCAVKGLFRLHHRHRQPPASRQARRFSDRRTPKADTRPRACLFIRACPDRRRVIRAIRCISSPDQQRPRRPSPSPAGRVACSTPSPRRRYGRTGACRLRLRPPPPGLCGSLPIATPGGRRLRAFRDARSR